jgi:transcriptional regulator with PAS, ATPase and Fis domain
MKFDTRHIKELRDAAIQEFILGSEAMRNVMETVRQAAPYDVNVLIFGESGTGKELLAKIIHLLSSRAERPFVPVNCGVLSGLIFEDKLFGHEKGAFTGAIRERIGCFEMAQGGTLFLDEVSELPYENQVDFLRVLEEFSFMRIGGSKRIDVDVRLVSATNKDLKHQIKRGDFREDLFYRLHVVPIDLPPLRSRKEAIPILVDHFLDRLSVKHKKLRPRVMPGVLNAFNEYNWPGNVRELRNLVERIFIINDGHRLEADMLPTDFLWHIEEPIETMDLADVRKKAEIEAISAVLAKTRGKRDKAAKILNISPRTLRHKIQQYHIQL